MNLLKAAEAYQEPPYNLMAERVLLGAILSHNDSLNQVGDFLEAYHFYEPVHQRIYQAVVDARAAGLSASPITLKNRFDKDGSLEGVGSDYLFQLVAGSVAVINIQDYGQTIYDLSVRRKLIEVGKEIVQEGYENESPSKDHLEQAERRLFEVASEGRIEKGAVSLRKAMSDAIVQAEAAYKRSDQLIGLPTGFIDLDNILGGLQDSDLIILAARPSMGKTALAVNIAVNVAKMLHGIQTEDRVPPSVGFFSLEMSTSQLATRMMAMGSAMDSSRIRMGKVSGAEFGAVARVSREMGQLPIHIDDSAALTISQLRTRARRMRQRNNIRLLVVDYLQLLRSKAENRTQEVSDITQGLKGIAKELNIPVLALSQLSRNVEGREDKRPQLADLRESGSIEQDADIVMFIYREEYYLSRKEVPEGSVKYLEWKAAMDECRNRADIIIAKHRNGPIGGMPLYFNPKTTTFGNMKL